MEEQPEENYVVTSSSIVYQQSDHTVNDRVCSSHQI